MQQITAKVKIFISQPMYGLTDEEIRKTYEYYTEKLKNKFPNAEFIFAINDAYEGSEFNRIDCLGRSITAMSNADFVAFLPGWKTANGCQIHHYVIERYGIIEIEPFEYLSQAELSRYWDEDHEIEEAHCKRNNLDYYPNSNVPERRYMATPRRGY